ncbi:MAG: DUF3793 family protein, partial [Acholeplasmatales bacterium]|nr:DUF3793 family protein [Acholeplasmatales bacterium]
MSTQLQRALAIHSAPALCGIKASNLINVDYSDDLFKEIEELNKKFTNFRFYILKKDKNKVLILIYRKRVLERELNRNSNKEFLKELGYDVSSIAVLLMMPLVLWVFSKMGISWYLGLIVLLGVIIELA